MRMGPISIRNAPSIELFSSQELTGRPRSRSTSPGPSPPQAAQDAGAGRRQWPAHASEISLLGGSLRTGACLLASMGSAVALDLPGAGEPPGILPSTFWFAWYDAYLGDARPVMADDYRVYRLVVGWHPN